jgi:membrane associated rhomboid family serine protease
MFRNQVAVVGNHLARHLTILLALVALLWLLEVIDLILWTIPLDAYGIRPRTAAGLRQIPLAPFLHVGFAHLAANTVPFVILGWLVLMRSERDFVLVSLIATGVSGLGVWLIGPTYTIHLGASGVIFGYLGYLWARGFFERSIPALALALVAGLLYGGILWGVLPGQAGVSWQGHLFGFLGGILAAYLLAHNNR